MYGSGDLCPPEWESFIRALDIGISPWFRTKSNPSNNSELLDEISALFTQIQRFLLKAPDIDYGLHPIVDDESRQVRIVEAKLNFSVFSNIFLPPFLKRFFSQTYIAQMCPTDEDRRGNGIRFSSH